MFDNYPDIMTVYQVQEALGVGKNTVYRLLKDGEIKSLKIGNKYKVPKNCLVAYAMRFLYYIYVSTSIFVSRKELK